MPALKANQFPYRLTALSVAIAAALGTTTSTVSAATCPKQMVDGETFVPASSCTGSPYAVQVGDASADMVADTLEVDSNVTLGGDGTANGSVGGVVIGLGQGATYNASLTNLTNNGNILGYDDSVTNPAVAGNGILMYSDAPTHIDNLTNNGTIGGDQGLRMIGGATIGTLTNNVGATIQGTSYGIFTGWGAGTTPGITTTVNNGTITSDGAGILVGTGITFNDIQNSGTIAGGSGGTGYGIDNRGTISTITNTGSISAGQDGIHNSGTITTINNYGSITGPGGNGIYNGGTINTLVNGQTSTLQYNWHAPQKYYTYFSDGSTYGKVHLGLTTYTLDTYGVKIADGKNWTEGTYNDVITSGAALTINNFEPVSGVTYQLVDRNGDGLVWDLVIGEVSPSRVYSSTQSLNNTPAGPAARVIDANSTLLSHFANLTTDEQLSDAATQVLPLLTGAAPQVIVNAMGNTNRVIRARQSVNRGMNSGDVLMTEKHIWAKVFGTHHNQDDRNNVTGYDGHSKGMVFGLDGDLNNGSQLGAAFAYGNTKVTGNRNLHSSEIDSYQLVGYGSYDINDRTEVSAQADFGFSQTDGERTMTAPVTGKAHSDYDSTSLHVGTAIIRDYSVGARTQIAPTARIDYTRVDSDSYTETGSSAVTPFLNRVASATTEALELGVGTELDHLLTDNTRLKAELGVAYDTMNEASTITSSFVGGGASFTTTGIKQAPWITRVGLGFTTSLQNGAEISAHYDAEARSDFLDQTASLQLRKPF